jgi:hypothetical protein
MSNIQLDQPEWEMEADKTKLDIGEVATLPQAENIVAALRLQRPDDAPPLEC